jgi:putative ABC transport system ATP-binding protein
MPLLIETQNLQKTYTTNEVETPVLFDIDMKIEKGEFVSIMGPSGSGKSTLMHILSFLDTHTGGKYFFDGKPVENFTSEQLSKMRNENVGFVFQAFNLLPRTSVVENVRLPLLYSETPHDKNKVRKAIEAVGLEHRANFLSNQLSGGEKQRVAIARAIVNNPSIIFADEPTGNLDSKSGNQILHILQDLNNQGKTIIMVTHERDTAEHAKRIIFIRDGKIERDEKLSNQRKATDGDLKK